MNTFDAYCKYLALKFHFTDDNYDFFRYNGKVRVSPASFDKREDKYWFTKLAQHNDPVGFCVANFVYVSPKAYIRDMFTQHENKEAYLKQRGRVNSLIYRTKEQLAQLEGNADDWLTVPPNKHPYLLRQFLKGTVDLETLIVVDHVVNYFEYWNRKLAEDVVWPAKYKMAMKYTPFIDVDSEKAMKTLTPLMT